MKRWGNPFRKACAFLVDRCGLGRQTGRNRELCGELIALAAGRKSAVREYYIRKLELLLLVAAAGMMAAGVCSFAEANQERGIRGQRLERPGYGEGDRSEELDVRVEGGEMVPSLEIAVQERKYTEEEQEALLEQADEEAAKVLLGENRSLDEIRSAVVFPQTLADGAVSADWATIPYGVIDEDGNIVGADKEEGTLVEIQGTLTCGEKELVTSVFAKVFPPVLSREEELRQAIQDEASAADDRDRYQETIRLPEKAGGKALVWERPSDHTGRTLLALTVLLAVCIYAGDDQAVHRKAQQRKLQLAADYPDLMWKMAMLIGAGLTIKGAFTRIVAQYQREKRTRFRYVYEEMEGACREMESGISEAEAYERFGRRCQLPEYIRLGSFLSQNLKKGSKGLSEFLLKEASAALKERKNNAKKLGEQAGTKLLLPMVLMLGVVLTVLMVPAFLSF